MTTDINRDIARTLNPLICGDHEGTTCTCAALLKDMADGIHQNDGRVDPSIASMLEVISAALYWEFNETEINAATLEQAGAANRP